MSRHPARFVPFVPGSSLRRDEPWGKGSSLRPPPMGTKTNPPYVGRKQGEGFVPRRDELTCHILEPKRRTSWTHILALDTYLEALHADS